MALANEASEATDTKQAKRPSVAAAIKATREAAGLTQADLARMLGACTRTVARAELQPFGASQVARDIVRTFGAAEISARAPESEPLLAVIDSPRTLPAGVRDAIVQARERIGWTVRQVAYSAGVLPSLVTRLESGERIELAAFASVLRALGLATRAARMAS